MSLENILTQHQIKSVWHFTDVSNLDSIGEHGLASLEKIVEEKISVTRFGADIVSHRLDFQKGLDSYVHLSFVDDHPMYHVSKGRGSIEKGIWIEFPLEIIFQDGVLFCDEVANKTGAKLYTKDEIANVIDFNTLVYGRDFEQTKEARKAEILIPNGIALSEAIGGHYGK